MFIYKIDVLFVYFIDYLHSLEYKLHESLDFALLFTTMYHQCLESAWYYRPKNYLLKEYQVVIISYISNIFKTKMQDRLTDNPC